MGIIPESCARRYQASMKLQVRHLGDAWAYRERTLLIRDEGVLPGCAQELLDTILNGEMGPLGAPPAS